MGHLPVRWVYTHSWQSTSIPAISLHACGAVRRQNYERRNNGPIGAYFQLASILSGSRVVGDPGQAGDSSISGSEYTAGCTTAYRSSPPADAAGKPCPYDHRRTCPPGTHLWCRVL